MRCDPLQPSWKPSFLCCSECSRKIGEYAPVLGYARNTFLGVRFCVVLPGTFNRKWPWELYDGDSGPEFRQYMRESR